MKTGPPVYIDSIWAMMSAGASIAYHKISALVCLAIETVCGDCLFNTAMASDERAEKSMEKAYQELNKNKSDRAIYYFRNAWIHGQIAVRMSR